jgi:hypothetical protein
VHATRSLAILLHSSILERLKGLCTMITRRTILGSSAGALGAIVSARPAVSGDRAPPVAETRAGPIRLAEAERKTTTADNPYVISSPVLGLVNLLGSAGNALLEQDRKTLGGIFSSVQVADRAIPRCNVLFLYCTLETSGRVAGLSASFRDVIKEARAHIAVLASDLSPAVMQNPEFRKSLSARPDWPANIVITLNRNGEHFGRFFQQLFSQMRAGVGMPMAWVKLAPQGPSQPKDIPGTIALMEAGHIAFGAKRN